jgi:hypothetical protein
MLYFTRCADTFPKNDVILYCTWEHFTKNFTKSNIFYDTMNIRRFQWPRGLRLRSTAGCLLRSWVRIPPGHGCLSVVCVVCCQVEVSATRWSLVQRSPTDCGASLCVISKPRERGGHSPRWAAEPEKKIMNELMNSQCYNFEISVLISITLYFLQ